MGLTYGGPEDKLTWGFSDLGTSSDPSSLKFCELILTPQIPPFFHCQESWRSIKWKKGKCFLADFFACHLCLEWWKLLSYQMIWGGYFLSLPWLLSTTSRDVLAELVDLIYGGLLKTTFSCVFVFSSVCATRQAFRLRGRSICISEGSRCSIINTNLEGKEKVKKGQIPYPTSGGFVLLLLSPFWGSWVLYVSWAIAPEATGKYERSSHQRSELWEYRHCQPQLLPWKESHC